MGVVVVDFQSFVDFEFNSFFNMEYSSIQSHPYFKMAFNDLFLEFRFFFRVFLRMLGILGEFHSLCQPCHKAADIKRKIWDTTHLFSVAQTGKAKLSCYAEHLTDFRSRVAPPRSNQMSNRHLFRALRLNC
jgi:hypothetical protein